MLPKKHRLSKSAEVTQTTARGRSFFNPYFVVKSSKADSGVKATVIVSTKTSKKAVVRNRLKRVIRNVLRLQMQVIKPGMYAIIVKPKAVTISSKELSEQVVLALKAAKIIT